MLLDKEVVTRMTAPPDEEPHVVYFNRAFAFTPDGSLLDTTYLVVRVGDHAAEFPKVFIAEEDANCKILNVEGRIIHRDGSSSRVNRDDFFSLNLSNGNLISDAFMRTAAIPDRLTAGDLVETVSLVQHSFPQMGIAFSPVDIGFAADNIHTTVQAPLAQDIRYALSNGTIAPKVQSTQQEKRYSFDWEPMRRAKHKHREMAQRNPGPTLYVSRSAESWKSLGDWYLALIGDKLNAGTALSDTARRITEGLHSPREKLDSLFSYCQRVVRYEQVYIAHGEVIPNAADLVFERRYGDCKDYAVLLAAMAGSVGVETNLALCYRGRGWRVGTQIPVMQFNHMILHYDDQGKDRWYDATDRLGQPGITSFDLANAVALILEKGGSHLATIEESAENLIDIEGTLAPEDNHGLRGTLTLRFTSQDATEFAWNESHVNSADMKDLLVKTARGILNEDMQVEHVDWRLEKGSFVLDLSGAFPNVLTTLGNDMYVSASRLFPNLLPDDIETDDVRNAYFFPYFNRVAIDINVNAASPLALTLHYQLPAGPFDTTSRAAFLPLLRQASDQYTHNYFIRKEAPK